MTIKVEHGRGTGDMPESMIAAAPPATNVYALGRNPGESERLQRQSEELRPDSAAFLDRVGLGPGQDAIDLGCGPRGILDLLAERVSPGGRVVGLAGTVPDYGVHTGHPAGR